MTQPSDEIEKLAIEYFEKAHLITSEPYPIRAFKAGYTAAQDKARAEIEELKAEIKELKMRIGFMENIE